MRKRKPKTPKRRNAAAQAVRSPAYRPRVVPNGKRYQRKDKHKGACQGSPAGLPEQTPTSERTTTVANRFHPGARWYLNPHRPYSYNAMDRWFDRLVAGKRPPGTMRPRIVRRAVPKRWWLTPASLDRTLPLYSRLLAKRRIS